MNGKIIGISEDFDTVLCKPIFFVTVMYEDNPNIKLGECVIKNADKDKKPRVR